MFGAAADGEGDAYEEQEMVEDEDVEEDEGALPRPPRAVRRAQRSAGCWLVWLDWPRRVQTCRCATRSR